MSKDFGKNFRAGEGGFTLLEMMFAMALFVMVAVGLLNALNIISTASLESGEGARLTRMLRSHLTEVTRSGELQPGGFETEAGADGIRLRTDIEELDMTSEKGERLPEMLHVVVTAYLGSQREPLDRAETWVYRPLYTPR